MGKPDRQLDLFDGADQAVLAAETVVVRLETPALPPSVRDLKMDGDMEMTQWLGLLSSHFLRTADPQVWMKRTWVMDVNWLDRLIDEANFATLGEFDRPVAQKEYVALALRVEPAVTKDGRVNSSYVRVRTGFLEDMKFSSDRDQWCCIDLEEDRVQHYFLELLEL